MFSGGLMKIFLPVFMLCVVIFSAGLMLGNRHGEKTATTKTIELIEKEKTTRFAGDYWIIPTKDGLLLVHVNKKMEDCANEYRQQKQSKRESKRKSSGKIDP